MGQIRKILIVVLFLAAVDVLAVTAQVRTVAPAYPPLVVGTATTITGGVSWSLVQEAFRRAGVPVTGEIQPFARVLQSVTEGSAWGFPLARTPDREGLFLWVGPVNHLRYQLFRLSTNRLPPLRLLADLGTRSVGVLTQDVIATSLEKRNLGTLVRVTDLTQLVRLLMSSRVDYIASTTTSVMSALRSLGLADTVLVPAFDLTELQLDSWSYLVAPRSARADEVRRVAESFRSMIADGTWDRLFREGLADPRWSSPLRTP